MIDRWRHALTMLGVLLAAVPARPNGEVYLELRDPRTGAVLPLAPTPVEIEGEELGVTLVERERPDPWLDLSVDYEFQVDAKYRLHNPTAEVQHLKIAFPLPYAVLLRESPVRLGHSPLAWRLLEPTDFLDLYRDDMHKALSGFLREHPVLSETLEALWAKRTDWRPSEDRTLRHWVYFDLPACISGYLDDATKARLMRELPVQYDIGSSVGEFWRAYRGMKGGRRCPVVQLFMLVQKWTDYRLPLLHEWAALDWFMAPASGHLVRAEDARVGEWDRYDLSVLLFETQLSPGERVPLEVRYCQPPGTWYEGGAGERWALPGLHFAYVIKVRPTWGEFGPINVHVRIPDYLRLRAAPRLAFQGAADEQREYSSTLAPYERNLHLVVGTHADFQPMLFSDIVDGFGNSLQAPMRQLVTGRMFVRLKDFYDWNGMRGKEDPIVWDEATQRVTVYSRKEEHARFTVGSREAWVDGKTIVMPAATRFHDGQVWIPVRALPDLQGEYMGSRLTLERNPLTGNVMLKTQRDKRR